MPRPDRNEQAKPDPEGYFLGVPLAIVRDILGFCRAKNIEPSALLAHIEELEAALGPFAALADELGDGRWESLLGGAGYAHLIDAIRRAAELVGK